MGGGFGGGGGGGGSFACLQVPGQHRGWGWGGEGGLSLYSSTRSAQGGGVGVGRVGGSFPCHHVPAQTGEVGDSQLCPSTQVSIGVGGSFAYLQVPGQPGGGGGGGGSRLSASTRSDRGRGGPCLQVPGQTGGGVVG